MITVLACLLLLCGTARAGLFDFLHSDPVQPGYRSLVDWIPAEQIRLDLAVWYPTRTAPSTITTGERIFQAARGSRPVPGRYPLLLLSPDSSGTRFAYHHLAERLVRRGFVVAAIQHEGDNADDMSLLFSDARLPRRCQQISAALDLLLSEEHIAPLIDTSRIALVGFGNGGTAGLLSAGASLTPDGWASFCPAQEALGRHDPYCEPYIAERMTALTEFMRYRTKAVQDAAVRRDSALRAREKEAKDFNEAMSRRFKTLNARMPNKMKGLTRLPAFLPPLPPLPPRTTERDARIGALVLVAPGYAMLFDRDSLAEVDIPVLLIGAPEDRLNRPDPQSLMLASGLTRTRVENLLLPEADSLSLMSFCPPELADKLPDFCPDADPAKHQRLADSLTATLVGFFDSALPAAAAAQH